jgi:murein DD-endopeptidase MepM/ murein hydrolase activator NlpD
MKGAHAPYLGAGLAIAGLLAGAAKLPYVNWRPVVPPVDAQPLQIRLDAKGDGRYDAPRSGNRRHRGVDLAAPLDSPVRAIRSGTVREVGTHRGLGKFVVLDHGRAMTSLYAHLNETVVEAGARVKQGQQIGTIGKTGNARHQWIAPHVHLEITRDGQRVDPMSLGLDAAAPGEPEQLPGLESDEADAHADIGE